jgi:hypothetical protein
LPNLDEEMKLKKINKRSGLFFLFGFFLSGIVISQTTNVSAISSFDSLFKEIKFDTLQICPAHLVLSAGNKTDSSGVNGKFISPGIKEKINFPFKDEKFYAIAKFSLDQKNKLKAYLVRQAGLPGVKITVFNTDSARFIFDADVAFYFSLEHTMAETLNTWVTDVNGDKVLDVAIMKYTHDFELPNKYAPNITGEEKHIYFFRNGKFEFARWDDKILPEVVLKK